VAQLERFLEQERKKRKIRKIRKMKQTREESSKGNSPMFRDLKIWIFRLEFGINL
jgi:hypothetical protein